MVRDVKICEGLAEGFGVGFSAAEDLDGGDRGFELGQIFDDVALQAGEEFVEYRCCHLFSL